MTPEQKKLARHALGLDNPNANGKSYRNRYYVNPKDMVTCFKWDSMVKAGLAALGVAASSRTTLMYGLTHEGAKLALNAGETLDPEDFP